MASEEKTYSDINESVAGPNEQIPLDAWLKWTCLLAPEVAWVFLNKMARMRAEGYSRKYKEYWKYLTYGYVIMTIVFFGIVTWIYRFKI